MPGTICTVPALCIFTMDSQQMSLGPLVSFSLFNMFTDIAKLGGGGHTGNMCTEVGRQKKNRKSY